MRYLKYLFLFLLGALITFLILRNQKDEKLTEASTTIAYGIKRLNKMLVAEQDYASFYSHKSKDTYLGNLISFDKNLLLKVNIHAQASYDLSLMKVDIDSANQSIIIQYIPEVKIETFPDVDFFDIQQSSLNQFEKNELNAIKERAVSAVEKEIDYSALNAQAEEQLFENLEDIYLLAKIYGWEIKNETKYADSLKDRIKF